MKKPIPIKALAKDIELTPASKIVLLPYLLRRYPVTKVANTC